MLKKVLASVSALALALGMIALVAGPASAHTNTINATVACNTDDGTYIITWKVKNSEASNPETITASSNTAVVPLGTQIAGGATGTFTQTVTSSGDYSLTLTGTWTNDNYAHESSGSISKQSFPHSCTPQLVKVTICHATPPDSAAQGWIPITIDDDAIDNHASHFTEHDADIIPAYDYWVQDHGVWTKLHFAGKNLGTVFYGATGAQILAAGCFVPETPAAPTFTQAVCTGPGVAGDGSYTIPTTTGVEYSVTIDGVPQGVQAAGTYTVVPVKTVVVTATSTDSGIYKVVGTFQWTTVFSSAGDCITTVTPLAPTFNDAVCTGPNQWGDGSFVIPTTAGVQYQVKYHVGDSYVDIDAGTYPVSAGTHVYIRAVALTGYAFKDGVKTQWHDTIGHPRLCLVQIPKPVVTDVQATCDGPGTNSGSSYTLPDETGIYYTVVINGHWHFGVAPGTYAAQPGDHVIVITTGADGYVMDGLYETWDFTFTDPGECLVDGVPTDPSVTNEVCVVDKDGNGSFVSGYITIPDSTGVQYYIDGSPVSAGDISVANGDHTVTATAKSGYVLVGYPEGGWPEHVAAADGCGNAQVVEPTVVDQTCVVNDSTAGALVTGYIDIPSTTGVNYFIDGAPAASGHHDLAPGHYTVTAEAIPNYTLTGYPEGGWSETIAAAELCGQLVDHPVFTPLVTFTQLGCSSAGSYTLSNDLGDANAAFWTVDGSPVAQGTYQVTSAKTVHVHVAANGPDYGFNDPKQQTDWTLTFAAPTTCDLKTLALTGTTPVGGMVLAYFMLLAGLSIVTVRAVRRHGRPQE